MASHWPAADVRSRECKQGDVGALRVDRPDKCRSTHVRFIEGTDMSESSKGGGAQTDIEYELVIAGDGTAALTCGGEMLWSCDGDEEYEREFGKEPIDIEDDELIDDVIDWLVEQGYMPPGVELDVVDLERSIQSLDG